MTESQKHKILLVDDEECILKSLVRLLKSNNNEIITSKSGANALEILKDNEISLIISDQRMPEMTGVELLKKSIEISPNTIRVLLTGYADIDATIKAINSGAIKYYFSKPWDDDLLSSRINESLDYYSTFKENIKLQTLTSNQNKELNEFNENLQGKVDEQTKQIVKKNKEINECFMETIKTFSTLIEMRNTEAGSHSQRVAQLVNNLVKEMNLDQKEGQDIVVAAYLHDIGKIALSDKILRKSPKEYALTDKEIVKKHPTIGQTCVYHISGFEEIGIYIRNHHENHDGSGYPDGLHENQISLGAKIIRICDEFDHYAFLKGYPDKKILNIATARLVQFSSTYFDPEIVKKFIEKDIALTLYHDKENDTKLLDTSELEEEMIIADDIYTENGMFLLPKGAKISKGMLSRIKKINIADPIAGNVRVYKNKPIERKDKVAI